MKLKNELHSIQKYEFCLTFQYVPINKISYNKLCVTLYISEFKMIDLMK